jgi:hypothetical protein
MGITIYSIECNNDESLMNLLGISKKIIKHSGNKTRVIKHVLKNEKTIGIIDEDPDSYEVDLTGFKLIKTYPSEIDLLQKRGSKNLLIILKPELEPWILKAGRIAKIMPKDYKLPEDPEKFKLVMATKNTNGIAFLNELKNKSSYFNELKEILSKKIDVENKN